MTARVRGAVAAAVAAAAAASAGWWNRPGEREWIEEREVAPPRVERRSAYLGRGWEIILEEGRPARVRVLVRAQTRGNRDVSRADVEIRLVRAPTPQVRLVGIARGDNPVNAPRITRAVRTHRLLATAYDPGPLANGWRNTGTTKLGWRTRRGIAAVDPAVIPLRRLLYVEGYGLAWTGDVGGAIRGPRMDLCFNRTEDAVRWGRRMTRAWELSGVRAED